MCLIKIPSCIHLGTQPQKHLSGPLTSLLRKCRRDFTRILTWQKKNMRTSYFWYKFSSIFTGGKQPMPYSCLHRWEAGCEEGGLGVFSTFPPWALAGSIQPLPSELTYSLHFHKDKDLSDKAQAWSQPWELVALTVAILSRLPHPCHLQSVKCQSLLCEFVVPPANWHVDVFFISWKVREPLKLTLFGKSPHADGISYNEVIELGWSPHPVWAILALPTPRVL